MIDFPITELLNEAESKAWVERHLHPHGFCCPQCHSPERRPHRQQGHFASYLCRSCGCYYTLLTGSALAGSRQSAQTLVLLLRGISQGVSTNRLHRELGMSYKQVLTLRHRLQSKLDESAPTGLMVGQEFEVDELYQNAGEKKHPHRRPEDPPRRRANQRRGHGTYDNDRPPIIRIISRTTGEQRAWVCDHADRVTCHALINETVPKDAPLLASDEWRAYRQVHPNHHTVCHAQDEWARDDDGDGRREVHCNTCEGTGTALRNFLRTFRGLHKQYLHLYVAAFEAFYNAKVVSPSLIRRLCFGGHYSWYV